MECPRCSTILEPTVINEVDVKVTAVRCPRCRGQLLETEALRTIERTVVMRDFLERPAAIPTSRTQHKSLRCPRCPSPPWMKKVSNERHEEVIMDVCPDCEAVWLDGGELERIREEGLFATLAYCLGWGRR